MEVAEVRSKTKPILLAMWRRPEKETSERQEWVEDVKANYLDLDQADQELIVNYLFAYNKYKRNAGLENYEGLKAKVLGRIATLYGELNAEPRGSNRRIILVAELINFKKAVIDTDIPVAEVKSRIHIQRVRHSKNGGGDKISMMGLRRGLIEIAPVNLPADITQFLLINKDGSGQTYFDYLGKNANTIFFTHRLDETVKMFPGNQWRGVSDELSRTIIVDTFSESTNAEAENWLLAATLIHEAAHVEWFHKYEKNPSMQHLRYAEENALAVERNFLKKILDVSRSVINDAQKARIAERIEKITRVLPKNTP